MGYTTAMKNLIAICLFTLFCVLVDPVPAHACSRILFDPAERSEEILPADRTYDIPVNTRIWVGAKHTLLNEGSRLDIPREVQLLKADDLSKVAGTQSLLDTADIETSGMAFSVFTPSQVLETQTEYQVVVQGEILAQFITGEHQDTTAPDIPENRITGTTAHDPDSTGFECSFPATATYEWESMEDAPIRLVAQIVDRNAPDLDEDTLEGALEVVTTEKVFTVAEFSDAEIITLQFAAFDLAGNFSGWSAPQETQLRSGGVGCACMKRRVPIPISLGLLLFLGLSLKRRAPSSRPPQARRLPR
jgi:hypothetical protein